MKRARSHGGVAAGHEHTAAAAVAVLAAGGNAYDAAVAAMASACVVEPVLASLGGGGYLLAWPHGERPRVYDFFVQTPAQRSPEAQVDLPAVQADFGVATQTFHIGAGAVAVPGMVAGLFAVHADLARVPIAELLQPAIDAARQGVPVRPFDARVLDIVKAIFSATAPCREAYASPADATQLLRTGDVLRQAQLADSLEAIAGEGEALFYRGEIGERLAAQTAAGGHLRRRDLEDYRVGRARALLTSHHGVDLACNPPPASGGLLIAFTLDLLRAAGHSGLAPGSCAALTQLLSAMALTAEARARGEAAGALDEGLLDPAFLAAYHQRVGQHPASRGGTTQISIIDGDGNVASASLSNGESAALLVPGTGILLNNMLGESDLNPGGLNRWPTATRLSSMMAPTVGRRADGRLIATGSGGSNRIRSAVVQVLLNLIDHGLDVHEAVPAPRVHLEGTQLNVEVGIDIEAIAPLLEAYPDHLLWTERSMFFGGAHTLVSDVHGGVRGCGDARRGGVCVVV